MAKRFGRNQRRKLREAVAFAHKEALRQAASAESWKRGYNRDVRMLRQRNGELLQRLDYVEDALKRFNFTALLPATSISATKNQAPQEAIRQLQDRHGDRVNLRPHGPSDEPVALQRLSVAELNHILTKVKRNGIDGTMLAHLFIEGTGTFKGQWSYAITDRALAYGIPGDASARLALHIAASLIAEANRHVTCQDARGLIDRVRKGS
jgi:hypothetical protein